MRSAALFRSALAFSAILVAAGTLRADVVRVLRLEIPAGAAFRVENLVGRMRARAGSGGQTVVVATIHAESEDLAAGFRLENVGSGDAPNIRVRYPNGVTRIRYRPDEEHSGVGFLRDLFSSFEGEHSYDGRSYRVGSSGGKLLFADVDIDVPRRDAAATFRNCKFIVGVVRLPNVPWS